jgi:hypothetical protein
MRKVATAFHLELLTISYYSESVSYHKRSGLVGEKQPFQTHLPHRKLEQS